MNILVTGSNGFLGIHVVRDLLKKGHKVTAFDSDVSNLKDLPCRVVQGDLRNTQDIDQAIKGNEVIMHMGAISDIDDCQSDKLEAININLIGTINILESCINNGISKLMFASTIYVNGDRGGIYRCTKQASEIFIREYSKDQDIDCLIIRYGSLYGPGSNDKNGLYRIIKNALKNKNVSYEGHKDTTREYIHVIDAASSTNKLLEEMEESSTVVITGQQSYKVQEILSTISEMLGYKKPVEFLDVEQSGHYVTTPFKYENEYPRKFIPDFHIDLGVGLDELIDYVKETEKLNTE